MVPLADISKDTLAQYEQLYIEYYTALYPTFNWAYGSFMYEQVIRPNAILAASQEQDLGTLRTSFSLYALSLQANPDPALAASLASNFRIVPGTGTVGSGELAVYSKQATNIYIRLGTVFTAGSINLVVSKTYVGVYGTTVYQDTADTEYRPMTQVGSEYVFIIPVSTVAPTVESVAEGIPVTMGNQPVQVDRVVVSSAVTGGTAAETTADLVARAATGVTARVPSGNKHLEALFKNITDVTVFSQKSFGMHDPEMLRDRNVMLVSMGGRVDAYCKTAQIPATRVLTLSGVRTGIDTWTLQIPAADALGFYYISSIVTASSPQVVTNQDEIQMTYRYETPDSNSPEIISAITARYSVYQAASVTFTYPGLTGDAADFTLSMVTMPSLLTLQNYINRRDVCNEANDVLIRAPVPCFVGVSVNILRAAGNTDVTDAMIQTAVSAAINGMDISATAVTAELVVMAVAAAYPTVKVDFPVLLDAKTYMPDGGVWLEHSCCGRIEPHEDLLQGVSVRNSAFFCYGGDVKVIFKDI